MMTGELMCADWDFNNLIPEWDWLFDDGLFTEESHEVLGFIGGVPCFMEWHGNRLEIKALKPQFFKIVVSEVKERTSHLNEDDQYFTAKVSVPMIGTKVIVETYFYES